MRFDYELEPLNSKWEIISTRKYCCYLLCLVVRFGYRQTRKLLYVYAYRGFKSHPLRHIDKGPVRNDWAFVALGLCIVWPNEASRTYLAE